MMALLPKKQKRELLVKLLEGFCIEIPKHTKTILVMFFILIGTWLGLDTLDIAIGITVSYGNDIKPIFNLFKKD